MKHICIVMALVFSLGESLALAQSSPDVPAEEAWYRVEIIVFANTDNGGTTTESWPDDPGVPDFGDALELLSPSTAQDTAEPLPAPEVQEPSVPAALPTSPPSPADAATPAAPRAYQLLPESGFTLVDSAEKLTHSGHYHPLLHVAWLQPAPARDRAKPVHIFTAMGRPPSELPPPESNGTLALPPSMEQEGAEAPQAPTPLQPLDGTIKVTRARFLHMDVDLLYRAASPAGSPSEGNSHPLEGDESETVYRMTESRRMRAGELHYFDHPLFGMLAQITPFHAPPAKEPVEEVEVIPLGESPAATGEVP